MPSQQVKCVGLIERIGFTDAIFTHEKNGDKSTEVLPILTHEDGLKKISNTLLDHKLGVLQTVDEIKAVGHRVVHGGSKFAKPTIVTQEVKDSIRSLFDLAPLHNPANLTLV